jgi:hypothetical protein
MFESPRIKNYTGVITFPATKSAGALTIQGTTIYDWESYAFGPIDIELRALLANKITNTLSVKLYTSYDAGTTWIPVATYSDLANGGAVPISAIKSAPLLYAPRIRLDAVFNGTGALLSGHGCGVDVKISEASPFNRHVIFTNVVTVPATKVAGALTYTGATKNTTMVDSFTKLIAVASAADLAQVTDTFTWKVQSSYDGTNWFDATAAQTGIAAGSGSYFTEVEVTTKLGKYARILLTSDATGALAAGHGIAFQLIGLI